jgi:hypothetical protein
MAVLSTTTCVSAPASGDPDRRFFLRTRAGDLMAEAGAETKNNRRVALIELSFIYWNLARELEGQ